MRAKRLGAVVAVAALALGASACADDTTDDAPGDIEAPEEPVDPGG